MKDLNKELNKSRQKEDSNSGKETEEAILFLSAPKENLQVLEEINLDHQIHKNKKKVDLKNKLTAFENIYNLKSFTGAEIKNLCNLYDLKCLTADKYKGKVDSELANKLIEFKKEHNIHLKARECFIVSTRESFEVENDHLNNNCIFLYCERNHSNGAQEDEVFSVVHTWGNLINTNRKYRYLLQHGSTYFTLLLLLILYFIPSMIVTGIFLLIMLFCILNTCTNDTFYDETWNKEKKQES
jgi:hypothetical protein